MKNVILAVSLLLFISVSAQAKKFYIQMEYNKNCIKLDDGTNKKPQTLKDENGNDLKFVSLMGALNYMSLQGWELLETKSLTSGGGYAGISVTDTQFYYIFYKEVTDEELEGVVNNSFKK